MYTKEETIFFMEQSDKVLKIIDKTFLDEITQSDLQGMIEAIIMTVYLKGKNNKNEIS